MKNPFLLLAKKIGNRFNNQFVYSCWSTGSSNAHIFGIPVFEDHKPYTQFFLMKAYWILYMYDSSIYSLRQRFIVKPHILKIKNIKPTSFHDIDHIMFHACFTLLGKFVENELGKSDNDNESYRGYRLHSVDDRNKIAIDLWLWYTTERDVEIKKYNEYLNRKFPKGSFVFDEHDDSDSVAELLQIKNTNTTAEEDEKYDYHFVDDQDDLKLRELMEIRTRLWT